MQHSTFQILFKAERNDSNGFIDRRINSPLPQQISGIKLLNYAWAKKVKLF